MLDLKRASGNTVIHMDTKTKQQRWLTPAQMTEKTGVNIDTLRYYEREGLINTVERTASGHRRYSADDVLWIEVLRCLRETGMSIDQLRTYCDLGAQGDHTQPERLQLLLAHRQQVLDEIARMHDSLKLVDHKIEFYQQALGNGSTS